MERMAHEVRNERDPAFIFVADVAAATHKKVGSCLRSASNCLDIPTPGSQNTAGWLCWHLCRGIDRNVSEMTETEQLWISDGHALLFRRIGEPSDTGYEHTAEEVCSFLSPEARVFGDYVDAVFDRLVSFVGALSDSDLERETDSPTLENRHTVRQRLMALCGEMLQHGGEIGVVAAYAEVAFVVASPLRSRPEA